MIKNTREYGSKGRVGISVPQANPTVEPEMSVLLPKKVNLLVSRLTSSKKEPKDRYLDYFFGLKNTLDTFDTLSLDACGFACTASTYLVGRKQEDEGLERLSDVKGYRIISAGLAIEKALRYLDVEKLAIGAPYPEWSVEMSKEYWLSRDFDVSVAKRIAISSDDTRAIYELRSEDALSALLEIDLGGVDAILLTGTGMPSLNAITKIMNYTGKIVVTSNLCLAWSLMEIIGIKTESTQESTHGHPLLNGWQEKIRDL